MAMIGSTRSIGIIGCGGCGTIPVDVVQQKVEKLTDAEREAYGWVFRDHLGHIEEDDPLMRIGAAYLYHMAVAELMLSTSEAFSIVHRWVEMEELDNRLVRFFS